MVVESIRPVNRRILIVPHFKPKEDRGFVLPDSYEENERYISATIISVAPDCAKVFRSLHYNGERTDVIVERSMIEEVSYRDKVSYIILENHVVAIIGDRPEEYIQC